MVVFDIANKTCERDSFSISYNMERKKGKEILVDTNSINVAVKLLLGGHCLETCIPTDEIPYRIMFSASPIFVRDFGIEYAFIPRLLRQIKSHGLTKGGFGPWHLGIPVVTKLDGDVKEALKIVAQEKDDKLKGDILKCAKCLGRDNEALVWIKELFGNKLVY